MSAHLIDKPVKDTTDEDLDHYCHPHILGKAWCGADYPVDETEGDRYVTVESVACVVCMDLDRLVSWWSIQTIF